MKGGSRRDSPPKFNKTGGKFPIVTRTSAELPTAASGSTVRMVTVTEAKDGQRIDNFLAGQLKGVPKSLIYRILRTGQVRLNGNRTQQSDLSERLQGARSDNLLVHTGDDELGPSCLQIAGRQRVCSQQCTDDRAVLVRSRA